MKTPPVQLDHLHVFGLESGSTQSEKGGGGFPPPPFWFHHIGDMDPHSSGRLLELVIWTRHLECGLLRWGYGHPCFGMAPRGGDMGSRSPVWHLDLGIGTVTPCCGPSRWRYEGPLEREVEIATAPCGPLKWGYGPPSFGVGPRVASIDFHGSVWPVELGIWTLALWCGLLS